MSDWLLHCGRLNSRIAIGGAGFVVAALLFLPAVLSHTLAISLPLFILAGIGFAAREPPLQAARLDVMHHRLWGRAEGVRTFIRRVMVATAPLAFGRSRTPSQRAKHRRASTGSAPPPAPAGCS